MAEARATASTRPSSGAGFGTLMIQLTRGPKETPPVASSRAYLRDGLPALYQDGDFGMRFVGALEELLDPIVAVLDALPAHFDPDLAPRDILNLLAAWLGVDLDESQDAARTSARWCAAAAELGRRRGTRARAGARARARTSRTCRCGSRTTAACVWSTAGERRRKRRRRQFVVYCDKPVAETTPGGDRPLHRAVQAGAHHLPAAREGSEEEAV